MFQFQTGSIKSSIRLLIVSPVGMFQFQTGSIKRNRLDAKTPGTTRFQFQTGSIKRVDGWFLLDPEETGFNSKLVRLKETCITCVTC